MEAATATAAAAACYRLSTTSKAFPPLRRRTNRSLIFLPSCSTSNSSVGVGGGGGTPATASPLRPPSSPLRTNRMKKKNKNKSDRDPTTCIPSPEEASISVSTLYQNGDPLGRKELGKCVVRWISNGMQSMASDFASAEIRGDFPDLRRRLDVSSEDSSGTTRGLAFVIHAQPYLYAVPMPNGLEALCFKACTHYPTLFDHFQRELRQVLQDLQRQSVFADWRDTDSWKLLKELAQSG